jgi:hypothetical protein
LSTRVRYFPFLPSKVCNDVQCARQYRRQLYVQGSYRWIS